MRSIAARAAGLGWAAFESARYLRMYRKRAAFGLADPVIANRFLLYSDARLLQRVLPGALAKLKVPQAEQLCEEIGSELQAVQLAAPMLMTTEDIFRRIGR